MRNATNKQRKGEYNIVMQPMVEKNFLKSEIEIIKNNDLTWTDLT